MERERVLARKGLVGRHEESGVGRQLLAIDLHAVADDFGATARHQLQRQRIEAMLDLEHTRSQGIGGVAGQYRDGGLPDDRA